MTNSTDIVTYIIYHIYIYIRNIRIMYIKNKFRKKQPHKLKLKKKVFL